MIYFLIVIAIALLALLTVILVRALRFKPQLKPQTAATGVDFDGEGAIHALGELVRCRTVSYIESSMEDDAEFLKLIDLLPKLYPNLFAKCSFMQTEGRGILLHWKGRQDGDPAVLMAHYDVVPVNEEQWEKPPFDAVIENGVMWGRGTLDTKATVNGILYAADSLAANGFTPENDVYLAFSGSEEVNGLGAPNIVEYFRKNNITPSVVLDEGGAVVQDVFPGVRTPCALVGIAEKGVLNLRYEARSEGGHASAPEKATPVGRLARACKRVEGSPFKRHITKPAEDMFDTLGRHSTFAYRIVFANMWCFAPLLDVIAKKCGGEMNALMRTTVAFTQMSGSSAPNVIPPRASMVSNIRLNPEDSIESAIEHIRRAIEDDGVELSIINGTDPSRISTTDCEGWRQLASAIEHTWEGAIVSPYLMLQCSDSRHYGLISDKVYRFSAMALSSEERTAIHGNNERITLAAATKAVEFYIRFIKQL